RLTYLVDKGLNVATKHPVDASPPDPERECIQRLLLTALRSEPVAEPQELRLVDRRQDRNHRRLDDLIFQCSDAERPLSAICLWNISPARWQRSIRSRLDARVEVREALLKAFRVFGPGHLVDAPFFGLVRLSLRGYRRLRTTALAARYLPRLGSLAMSKSRVQGARYRRMPASAPTWGWLVSCDIDTDHLSFCWTENISARNLS